MEILEFGQCDCRHGTETAIPFKKIEAIKVSENFFEEGTYIIEIFTTNRVFSINFKTYNEAKSYYNQIVKELQSLY